VLGLGLGLVVLVGRCRHLFNGCKKIFSHFSKFSEFAWLNFQPQ